MTSLVSYRATSNNIPIRNPYARRYTTKPKSYSTETEKNNKENNSNTSHSPRYLFGSKEGTSFATPLDLSCSPSPCKDLSPLPPQEVYYKKKTISTTLIMITTATTTTTTTLIIYSMIHFRLFPKIIQLQKTTLQQNSGSRTDSAMQSPVDSFSSLSPKLKKKNIMTNMNCYTTLKEYFTCPLNLWTKATT